MQLKTLCAIASVALLWLAAAADADLKILKSGSPISGSEVITRTKVGGMWNIDIRPVGNPGATITI